MTIVEFFDKDSIENIVSTLLSCPDRVIFIGDKNKAMNEAKERYMDLVNSRNKSVEFIPVSVPKDDLERIIETLNNIIEKYGEIEIDLTGGEDLYLVGAGVVYQAHPDKVRLHRFNINNGILHDCDADGNVINSTPEFLSVEENISIYGGRVAFYDEDPLGTINWDFNDEFVSDVDLMWNICREDIKTWKRFMVCKEEKNANEDDVDDQLHFISSVENVEYIPRIVEYLAAYGLIENIELINGYLCFDCKNLQIKHCLAKAGQILEIKIAVELLKLNKPEKTIVNDILTGVMIYWDDEENLDSKANIVKNEIDVVVMKGLVPVFISCKNGIIEVEELYKLNTVASRFGGKYAKKVLVAAMDASGIRERAEEMNIKVIDQLASLDLYDENDFKKFKKEIEKILK